MDDEMAYAARDPDRPGFCAIQFDEPAEREATAFHIADWIMRGYHVERVTKKQAVEGIRAYMGDKIARLRADRGKLEPFKQFDHASEH
jgi:hypothetical protein